jgi:cation-transporting ATPase E
MRRQDGHVDRKRYAGIGSQPLSEAAVGDILAQLASDDARPNASMQAIGEAYKMPPGWTATATAPFKSATKWSGASYGEHATG